MRVKIAGEWFDSKDEPICVELSEIERRHIMQMPPDATKYGSAPDHWFREPEHFREWMRDERNCIHED